MRVIAGKYKRARLCGPGPKNKNIRATYDRVRENVFNLLGDSVEGAAVLDLFGGSGSIGIEAASRGAESVLFVESSPEALRLIRRNIENLGLESRCRVVRADAVKFLHLSGERDRYDIIYADPPYRSDLFGKAAAAIEKNSRLAEGGTLVGEHGRPGGPPETDRIGRLEKTDTRKYGRTWLTLWKWAGDENQTRTTDAEGVHRAERDSR